MRNILKLHKRGLSEIVGYVLLIVIALSVSIAVAAWINYQLPKQKLECKEDVSLVIRDYDCGVPESDNYIELTLENRGLFKIDGFYVRVRETGQEGLATRKVKYAYTNLVEETNEIPQQVLPGNEISVTLNYLDGTSSYESIDMIEIEPFQIIEDKIVLCEKAVIKQPLSNC